ncbi:signal peptidase complex catalytic subunit sec11 [Anaeramoeba ignava]|uniref:Signal peptidase complex catalytic subunit SEC11 n=1 Tax=Anaeramoeba ignava TaxID=1746090 RepID=A0A9Q0LI01_ANAIG|nr:signal peptidase complex catalytic subunit sec11 [Anaeramoeba ignava]
MKNEKNTISNSKKIRNLINSFSIFGFVLFLWNVIRLFSDLEAPLVVVLSSSMYPTLCRGDVLLISHNDSHSFHVGEIIVFHVTHRSLPVVNRIISIHIDKKGIEHILTKGDQKTTHDRALYNYEKGQSWIQKEDIIGVAWVIIPKIGLISVWINEIPLFKIILSFLAIIFTYFSY